MTAMNDNLYYFANEITNIRLFNKIKKVKSNNNTRREKAVATAAYCE